MVTREVGRMYLEYPVRIPLVHLEAFDSHEGSQVFSIAHVCGPAVVMNIPNTYGLPLKNIGGWHDAVSLADLGEKQQTPLPVFVIKR